MPWGTTSFSLLYDWVSRSNAGLPTKRIDSASMLAQDQDLADGLEACIKHNGDIAATADLPMATFKHLNVGAAALRSQYARATEVQDGVIFKAASPGGTIDAMTGTLAPAITAYVAGMIVSIVAPGTGSNTVTTPTLALNAIASPRTIRKHQGALAIGDYSAGDTLLLLVESTTFELLNPRGVAASGNTVVNNGSGSLEVALPRNAQVGTTYTMLTGDRGKHVTFDNGSAIAVTLPQAGSAGFLLGWYCFVENLGAGAATITPTTSTINGAATLVLTFAAAQAYLITSDGTNYRALPMYTPAASAIDFSGLTIDSTLGDVADYLTGYDVSGSDSNRALVSSIFGNAINSAAAESTALATDRVAVWSATASAFRYETPLTLASGTAANTLGYKGAPITTQNGNATVALADCGTTWYHTSGSTHTWTIDSNANLAVPIGTIILLENENGGGNVTVAITTDTLRWGSSTGSRTLAANGSAAIKKVAATTWRMTGTGIT